MLLSHKLFVASIAATPSDAFFNLWMQKISEDPFRLVAFLIFMGAVFHSFFAGKLASKAKTLRAKGESDAKATIMHWLGEVEAIFGIWLIPLVVCFVMFKGWNATVEYFSSRQYTEPIFVFGIMTIASTRPILYLAEACIQKVVHIFGQEKPSTWWLCILILGPLLGSLITEPAAMTISAMLLAEKVYKYKPSAFFSYGTLGLLFVNISVGGVLTNFASPPILMIASKWNWSNSYVFSHLGIYATLGILIASLFYFLIFSKQLHHLNILAKNAFKEDNTREKIPTVIIGLHVFFLAWVVFNAHHTALLMWGFLAFLAAANIFKKYQSPLNIKESLLVGCFLAGLVTHGGLQEWWIEIVLSRLNDTLLFLGSAFLTAFNDNASITYLASLVPEFLNDSQLQLSVVGGAVVGGGLTVIANAPNPAGQSLLSKFFKDGIVKPLPLFLGALLPTIFLMLALRLLPHWL